MIQLLYPLLCVDIGRSFSRLVQLISIRWKHSSLRLAYDVGIILRQIKKKVAFVPLCWDFSKKLRLKPAEIHRAGEMLCLGPSKPGLEYYACLLCVPCETVQYTVAVGTGYKIVRSGGRMN